jgi:hypothetical protein
MRIEVTQEDIDQGLQGDGSRCAIALAIRRAGLRVSVMGHEICTSGSIGMPKYYTPGIEIRHWIGQFDYNRKNVEPFAFELKEGGYLTPIKEEVLIPAMIPAKKETVHATEFAERVEGFRQGSLR